MSDATLDLVELSGRIADDLGDVSTVSAHGVVTYVRGGQPFARATRHTLEVWLARDAARAARRRADTDAADEQDWVRFTPFGADDADAEQAETWFRAAWRHAASR